MTGETVRFRDSSLQEIVAWLARLGDGAGWLPDGAKAGSALTEAFAGRTYHKRASLGKSGQLLVSAWRSGVDLCQACWLASSST